MPSRPPLKPLVVDVLLALSERPRHGYALMKHLREVHAGAVHTGPLYRTLRSLLDDGLIEEVGEDSDGGSGDARRGSSYTISDAGREVLGEELTRLRAVVARAGRIGIGHA